MQHKIYIIDDEKDLLALTQLVLEKHNYLVFPVQDLTYVLEEIKELKPNLIILDYLLLEDTGLEIIEKIRKNVSLASIPTIMTTGHDITELLTKSNSPDDIIMKPFDIDHLIEKIVRLLSK